MKLTILGSGSGRPTAGKNLSSLLLENQDSLFLLDCGEPVARVLAERLTDPDKLKAVVITHFHPDHASGIYMLLQLLHIQKRSRPLQLFLPENIPLFSASLTMFYLFKLSFPLNIISIKDLSSYYPWLKAFPNDHLHKYARQLAAINCENEAASFSIFISAHRNALYSSDIASLQMLSEPLALAEIVILDALHPTPSQICEVLDSDKTVILTHGMHPDLPLRLKTYGPGRYVIAEDGFEIEL